MNKLFFGSVVLTSLMAAQAMAADIPVKAPPRVAVFSWQGCYVGVSGGWIGSRDRYRLQPSGNYLSPPGGAAPPNTAGSGDFAANIAALTTGYKESGSGGIIGGTIGCNVQAGHWVGGLEGDVSWTDPRTTVNAAYAAFPDVGNTLFATQARTEHVSNRLDGLATFRGRLGYTLSDRALLFATTGVAAGRLKSETSVLFGTGVGTNPVYAGAQHVGSDTFTRAGLTAGGGAEYAITDNLSFKAEYLFVAFTSHESYRSPLTAAAVAFAPGYAWQTSVSSREHIVRVGLNLKLWDWGR